MFGPWNGQIGWSGGRRLPVMGPNRTFRADHGRAACDSQIAAGRPTGARASGLSTVHNGLSSMRRTVVRAGSVIAVSRRIG